MGRAKETKTGSRVTQASRIAKAASAWPHEGLSNSSQGVRSNENTLPTSWSPQRGALTKRYSRSTAPSTTPYASPANVT